MEADEIGHDRHLGLSLTSLIIVLILHLLLLALHLCLTLFDAGLDGQECPLEVLCEHISNNGLPCLLLTTKAMPIVHSVSIERAGCQCCILLRADQYFDYDTAAFEEGEEDELQGLFDIGHEVIERLRLVSPLVFDRELTFDVIVCLPLLIEECGNLAVLSFHLHGN